MGYWDRPNVFKVCNFIEVPMGAHRVKITSVSVVNYRKSKKKCFEIALKVSRQPGRLWYHLWYSPDNKDRTNADFLAFFRGFQIEEENRSLQRYKKWIGKTGAAYVWHEHGPTKRLEEGEYEAMISCFMDVRELDKLPPWSDVPVKKETPELQLNTELPF